MEAVHGVQRRWDAERAARPADPTYADGARATDASSEVAVQGHAVGDVTPTGTRAADNVAIRDFVHMPATYPPRGERKRCVSRAGRG